MNKNYGVGVKYRDPDYAGIIVRTAISAIDLFVVLLVLALSLVIDIWLIDDIQVFSDYYLTYAVLFISYIYLTTLKASRFGTLGQLITKTRIETIRGKRPGQLRMTCRLLFWLFGPANFLTDLVFLTMIKEKRSIRDCFCNTIVVKKCSEPLAQAVPVRITRVYAFGLNIMYESCYADSS
jgi:uncharacterized RDD family membrane protein YckC